MSYLKRIITVSVIAICFIFAGVSVFAETPETEPEQEPETPSTKYMMKIDGVDYMVVDSKEEGEAAIKELVESMLPKNSTLRSYDIEEKIEYVPVVQSSIPRGVNVADEEDEISDILEDQMDSSVPPLTIKIVSDKYNVKRTPIKVKFKYKKNLYDFQFIAKNKGSKGKTRTRYELTSVNGDVTSKVKKETKTVEKGEYKIVYTGRKKTPKDITATRYKTYKAKVEKKTIKRYGDVFLGLNLVEYGKQFLGNPYRVGGKSLTNGIDCVQFVRALYKKFGIHLPENRHKLFRTGKVVPYSKARPGDVVFYGKHPAVYIGNGKIISARKKGIAISNINYKRWTYIRRMR